MTTTLNDLINNINAEFPYANVDNSSQGFRENFHYIKYALANINENPYQLAIASAGGLGGVKVGYGLTMNSYTGVLSVSQIVATTNTLGFIRGGTGLVIDPTTGVTSVTPGSDVIVGGVKSDSFTTSISNTGTITATGYFTGAITGGSINSSGDGIFAGNGTFGGDVRSTDGDVRAKDGIFSGNIYGGSVLFSGELSADLPLATATGYVVNFNTLTHELIYVPDTTNYTLSTATSSILGGVKIGTGIDILADGTISVNTGTPYVLPPATYSELGGLIVGPGFTVDGNGVLSFVNPGFDGGTINQPLIINEYTQSYSTQSGALIVQGGAGFAGTVWVNELSTYGNGFIGGQLFLQNTTQAVSAVSGALVVAGGVGISGNLHVAGEIIAQKLTIQLTTVTTTLIQTDDIIKTSNNTQSISTDSGALQITGGVGIGRDLIVGGGMRVLGDANVTGTVYSTSAFAIPDRFEVTSSTFETITTMRSYNTTSSTSTTTGALIVDGGVGVGGDIWASKIYSNGVQLANFNTSTLVATSVFAQTFNTSTLVATSVFAQTFNTSTLVANAVNQVGGTVNASVLTATNINVGSSYMVGSYTNAFYINTYGIFDEAASNNQVFQIVTNVTSSTGGTLTSAGGGGIWTAGGGAQVYSSAELTFRMGAVIKQGSYPTGGTNPTGQNVTFSSTGSVYIGNQTASTSPTTGALQVNGGAGVNGNVILAGYLKTVPTTVNALPSASAVGAGARAFVTDSTVTTFLAIAVSGGFENVPVVSNGTNWLVG